MRFDRHRKVPSIFAPAAMFAFVENSHSRQMRAFSLMAVLAIATPGQAVQLPDSVPQIVQVPGVRPGEPMAWKYSLLRTGESEFEKHRERLAPRASLAFKLPNVDQSDNDNRVDLVASTGRIPLTMVTAAIFALPAAAPSSDNDVMVVANKNFPKGSFRHPNVLVRSPGLPDGVKRMGDLRLACAAQLAMAKAQDFKFRALITGASLFGDPCAEMEVTNIGAPAGPYDTVTVEDANRTVSRPRGQAAMLKLGDRSWTDEARIQYSLKGAVVD